MQLSMDRLKSLYAAHGGDPGRMVGAVYEAEGKSVSARRIERIAWYCCFRADEARAYLARLKREDAP